MTLPFDRNMFSQIGLDSGSLTMLGTVLHSFGEPGKYRGSVHDGESQAVFYISVDKNSPVAQVDIDLAALMDSSESSDDDCCAEDSRNWFSVNPKGYAVFHVSKGGGGYHVIIRKAEEDPETRVFDSRSLGEGDLFAATIIRPGTYSVVNSYTEARAEVVVSYPEMGKRAYKPPGPVRVQAARKYFEPQRINLKPGQGMVFECNEKSRMKITLQKADDGPGYRFKPARRTKRQN